MTEFSIAGAALTGFRVMRDKPKAVAVWVLVRLLVSLLLVAAIVTLFGDPMTWMTVVAMIHGSDLSELGPLMWKVLPFYVILIVSGLLYGGVMLAAMNRAVLRPQDDEFGYLRLGSDELRQMGLILLLVLVAIAFSIVFGIVAAVLAILAKELHAPVTLAYLFGVDLPLLTALAFVCVRFSLASARTFSTRRISLAGAWGLTRGRFWPLLGVIALTAVIVWAVTFLANLLIGLVVHAAPGGAVIAKDPFSAALTPAIAVQLLLDSLLSALTLPLLLTPMATVYGALFKERPAMAPEELPDPTGLV